MKRLIFLPLIALVCVPAARADTYVKILSHTDSYYHMGLVTPAEDSERELWVGDSTVATYTANRIFVADLRPRTICVVNRNDSTFVETTLPLDVPSIVAEDAVPYIHSYKVVGTVKPTTEEREIGGRSCKCYEGTYCVKVGDECYYETDLKMWVTTDVPFDSGIYSEIITNTQKLLNYDDELLEQLAAIRGFPVLMEATTYASGLELTSYESVVEISEKEPGADVYSVPGGFKQKEKLSLRDLRNR